LKKNRATDLPAGRQGTTEKRSSTEPSLWLSKSQWLSVAKKKLNRITQSRRVRRNDD